VPCRAPRPAPTDMADNAVVSEFSWVKRAMGPPEASRLGFRDTIYPFISGAQRASGDARHHDFHDHGSLVSYIDPFDP
jgi:hypothetical protein